MSQTADRIVHWLNQHSRTAQEAGVPSDVPFGGLADFSQQGLLGMQVGADCGGLGLCHRETVQVLDQLGGVDLAASLFVGLNNYLGVWPILRHGQPRLQGELLSLLAKGECLVGFAFAEPSGGFDSERWSARAEAVNGSGWKLSGTKFVSGSLRRSSILNAFVRHGDQGALSAFVTLPRADLAALSGPISIGDLSRETVNLDGLFVPTHRMLGRPGEGLQIAFEAMRHSHFAIGAACLGGIKRCSQLIFEHATQRQVSTTSFLPHPVTVTRLGRITAEITALESLIRFLAEAADARREIAPVAFAVCRLIAPDMLWEAADDLVQLLGRRGLVETSQVRRLVDDARTLRGMEGPRETAAAAFGAQLLSAAPGSLESLVVDAFELTGSNALLAKAGSTLLERALATRREASVSERHWTEVQAGELTAWAVLFGAVERRRQSSSSADLDRALTWISSNLEAAISLTRAGPPLESRGDAVSRAVARYGYAAGSLAQDHSAPINRGAQGPVAATNERSESATGGSTQSFGTASTDSTLAMQRLAAACERVTRLPMQGPAAWLFHETCAALHDVGAVAHVAELAGIGLEELRKLTADARAFAGRHSRVFEHTQNWPHGYPGDFEIVERMCECRPEGQPGSIGHVLDSYVLNLPIVQQHRAKVAWQAQLVRKKLAGTGELRLLSIACGGSRDLLLLEPHELARMKVVLADFEEGALQLSSARVQPHVLSLITIQGNVLRLMERLRAEGPYDVVLIGGLLDYLPERLARTVLTRAFRMMAAGGLLGVTNLATGNPWRLLLGLFTNWVLIERSEEEMLQLLEASGVSCQLTRDETGLTWLARGDRR